MAARFVRNFLLALGTFAIMATLVYTDFEIAQPVTEYVSYVVTTDFSLQPILQKFGFPQTLSIRDLNPLGW